MWRSWVKGGTAIPADQEAITITRSLPHGPVAAVLGTLRKIGLDRLLGPAPRSGPEDNRCRDLVVAMIASRIIAPASKLATATALDPTTAATTLGEELGLGAVSEVELYAALDWLLVRQPAVENALARRHLKGGTLVLYDVSSSYFEGRCCELARRGYSRDDKKGSLQIVYGLLCAPDGCPVAIEVLDGNTGDPDTVAAQISKLKQRFGLSHVVLVGDRGMITEARIGQDVKPAGFDWITALRAPAIKDLVEGGAIQMSLFDDRDMAAITSPDYPGERLIVCRNPDLARERGCKREDLLQATERDLAPIVRAVARKTKPLHGAALIGLRVGAVLNKHKMAKHFELSITDTSFTFARKTREIAAEAARDGVYVVRTSVPAESLDDAGTVRAYKSLSQVDIDQSWRLSRFSVGGMGRIDRWRSAAPWERRCKDFFELGDGGGIGMDESGMAWPRGNLTAAETAVLDPAIESRLGHAEMFGQFPDSPFHAYPVDTYTH